jgi:hypothetical protein
MCRNNSSNAQLFAALLWVPKMQADLGSVLVASVYTYTVLATSPCTVNATATVTVTHNVTKCRNKRNTYRMCGNNSSNPQLFAKLVEHRDKWYLVKCWLVYTYTVAATSPCTVAATAAVTVYETACS